MWLRCGPARPNMMGTGSWGSIFGPPQRLLRRCVGGRSPIDRGGVGMAVDDLPLAVLPTVDVGDVQGVRREWGAVPRHRGVLVADGVGQVPADARGDQLEAVGGAVGEPRPEPAEELAYLVPSARA